METDAPPPFAPVEAYPPPANDASPRLDAGRAVVIFLLVHAAEIIIGVIVTILVAIVAVVRNVDAERAIQRIDVVLLVVSFVAGGIVFYGLTRSWAPQWLQDQRASGFGSVGLPVRHVVVAAACGLAITAAYLLVAKLVVPPTDISKFGPVAQMARRGGVTLAVIAFVALLLAPPFEEVMYRGLLLEGFRESWGFVPAALVVTVLFMLVHIFEISHYWPSAAAIFALAGATLAVRVRMRSIMAAIILHAAYNAGMVLWETLWKVL